MATMAALEPPKGSSHTSVPETTRASTVETSETVDQADAFQLFPIPGSTSTVSVPGTAQVAPLPNPPNSRNARSQSLAIRRKPLSSTASPLATRYSSRDHLEIVQLPGKPETRFARSHSVDSPTLYEFPQDCRAPISSLESLASTVTSAPSQQ